MLLGCRVQVSSFCFCSLFLFSSCLFFNFQHFFCKFEKKDKMSMHLKIGAQFNTPDTMNEIICDIVVFTIIVNRRAFSLLKGTGFN